jgi:hypothetical protein
MLTHTSPGADAANHPKKRFHTDSKDCQRSKPPRESPKGYIEVYPFRDTFGYGISRNKFGVSSRKNSTINTG